MPRNPTKNAVQEFYLRTAELHSAHAPTLNLLGEWLHNIFSLELKTIRIQNWDKCTWTGSYKIQLFLCMLVMCYQARLDYSQSCTWCICSYCPNLLGYITSYLYNENPFGSKTWDTCTTVPEFIEPVFAITCARIYRPSFHENKPKTLVFT